MKIYYQGAKGINHRLFVSPGQDHPEVAEWRGADGKPLAIVVHFVNGVADVDNRIGEYCIKNGLATKSRIIANRRGAA